MTFSHDFWYENLTIINFKIESLKLKLTKKLPQDIKGNDNDMIINIFILSWKLKAHWELIKDLRFFAWRNAFLENPSNDFIRILQIMQLKIMQLKTTNSIFLN